MNRPNLAAFTALKFNMAHDVPLKLPHGALLLSSALPSLPRRERTVVPSALTNQSILFRSIQFLFSSNGLAAAIERENTRSCADEFGFEKAVTHHPSPVPVTVFPGRSSK